MNEIKSRQQRLESSMGRVGADEQGEGALGRDGPGGSLGQPGDFVVKYGLGRARQQVGQGGGLGADLIDRQAQLIDADQDGDGREDGQKGEDCLLYTSPSPRDRG